VLILSKSAGATVFTKLQVVAELTEGCGVVETAAEGGAAVRTSGWCWWKKVGGSRVVKLKRVGQ
jgi:hypothetical protein